jgi:hypothetical protein
MPRHEFVAKAERSMAAKKQRGLQCKILTNEILPIAKVLAKETPTVDLSTLS